jgi:hypothetical protein
MGRFYQHTTSPVVDYSYDVPFTELWQSLEYKQGRQDTALNKLSVAKDKLTNLEYIPGSSDEEYLKQKQAQYDALSEQVSGMDLSGNQGALNTAISEFADDPRLANVQRNATFYKEQQDRMQTLADSGMLDYNNVPDWAGQTDSGNKVLSERIMSAVDPNPHARAFFESVDADSVAANPAILDRILEEAMDVFPNDPMVQSYVVSKGGDPTNALDREAAAKELLEAARAQRLMALGIDPDTGGSIGGGGGESPIDSNQSSHFVAGALDTAIKGGEGSVKAEHLNFSEAEMEESFLESLMGSEKATTNFYKVDVANTDLIGGQYETARTFLRNNQEAADKLAKKYGLWDENDPEGSRNALEEHMIAQKFYDEERFRELENNRKKSEQYDKQINSGQYSKEKVEEFKKSKAALDKKIERVSIDAERVAIQTGINPLEYNKDGSYKGPAYAINKEKYDSDEKAEGMLRNLFNMQDIDKSNMTVEILDNNNLIYKNGKAYVKGMYTFDENAGDKMFNKDAGWWSRNITPSSSMSGSDWVDYLVDDLGLVKQIQGNPLGIQIDDDNNLYQIPTLIELSPDQLRGVMQKVDQASFKGTKGYDDSIGVRDKQLRSRLAQEGLNQQNILIDKGQARQVVHAKRLLEAQGTKDFPATGTPGYKTKTDRYLKNTELTDNETQKVQEYLGNLLDSNGDPLPGKIDELANFYARIDVLDDSLNTKLKNATPDEHAELKQKSRDLFIGNFKGLTGEKLLSTTQNDMESYGIEATGGGSYKISDINTFKEGVKSWAASNDLNHINNDDYPGISFDSNITSAADIYGAKVSSPYLSPKATQALENISTLASNYGYKIGVNSMGRPDVVQGMLFNSKNHEAAKNSAHTSGNAMDLNVKEGSREHTLVMKALRGTGAKTYYHDGHLHVEVV